MRLLELTLATPEENLALDEALLEAAESSLIETETLRLWSPASPLVVLGRSSNFDSEARAAECRCLGVPILRRTSGGATILTGPGCLMYAVVLNLERRPELRAIDQAHRFVLETNRVALGALVSGIERRGTSDLALGDRKFSGNSLRVRRNWLLYHGTLLFDFDLRSIGLLLGSPVRQPDYRQRRSHIEFVMNLPASHADLSAALKSAWNASEPLDFDASLAELTARFVAEKYSRSDWNFKGEIPIG